MRHLSPVQSSLNHVECSCEKMPLFTHILNLEAFQPAVLEREPRPRSGGGRRSAPRGSPAATPRAASSG